MNNNCSIQLFLRIADTPEPIKTILQTAYEKGIKFYKQNDLSKALTLDEAIEFTKKHTQITALVDDKTSCNFSFEFDQMWDFIFAINTFNNPKIIDSFIDLAYYTKTILNLLDPFQIYKLKAKIM